MWKYNNSNTNYSYKFFYAVFVLEYKIYISRLRQDSADLLTDVEKSLTVQRSLLSPKIQDPPTPLFLLLSVPESGEVSDGYIFIVPKENRICLSSYFFLSQVPRHGRHGPPLYPAYLIGVNIWNNLVFGNLGRSPHLNIKVSLQSDFEKKLILIHI